MPEILINVINKIPQLSGDVRQITADNSDYTIRFVFDDGWGDGSKAVYFVRDGGFAYPVGRTEHDTVTVPAVKDVRMRTALYIGVQQGDVRTSRPCMIPVYHAITDMIDDEAVQPEPSMWEDVMARLEHLEQNPIDAPPAGRAVVTLYGTGFDDIVVESVVAPDEESDPVELLAAGQADVFLAMVRDNETVYAPLDLVDFDDAGFTATALGNVVMRDGVYTVAVGVDFGAQTASAEVINVFSGGSGGSGWIEIMPESESVRDDSVFVGAMVLPGMDVAAGDRCRIYYRSYSEDGEVEIIRTVTAAERSTETGHVVLLADMSGDGDVRTFALLYNHESNITLASDVYNSSRCIVRVEKLVDSGVSREEFDALREVVETQQIKTYILQESETPDDAPEWADEVIDPFHDPESEPGGDVDLEAVNRRLDELSEAIADVEEGKIGAAEVVAPMIVGTSIAQKCAEFSALMRDTERVESFIFFTDPHLMAAETGYEEEFRKYIRTLKAYYSATPTSFVVCGGDWLELHNRSEACFRLGYVDGYMRNNFDRYYSVVGNHDHNHNTSGVSYPEEADVGRLPIDTVKNLMMRDEEHTYYTFDGANTTFYVLDSGAQWYYMLDQMWEQVEWLAGKLKSKDAENSAIIIHAAYEADASSGEIVLLPFMTNVLALCQAYNEATAITLNGKDYDFAGCKGRMRFVLSGHKHQYEYQEVVRDIPIVRTTHMRAGKTPTFDLCLADYKNNKLHLIRVGSGNSRIVELTSAPQPYPDETMVYLIGKERNGSKIVAAPASHAQFVSTTDTGVKYTDAETGEEYYTMLKPEGATKVILTTPGMEVAFDEISYNNSSVGKSGWMQGGGEYNLQTDTWLYILKVKTADGSAFPDDITGIVSWAFGGYHEEAYTNRIRSSIGADGKIYNGIGYKPRTRIGTGSGAEVEHDNFSATGFIPAKFRDTFRTKNISTTGEAAISLWDESFNFITASYLNQASYTVDENGVLSGEVYRDNAAYIRITGQFFDNPIVTVMKRLFNQQ